MGNDIPQAVLALDRDREGGGGPKRKGKEQARKLDYKSIETRLFPCVSNFSWAIKLDLELADRVSEVWEGHGPFTGMAR